MEALCIYIKERLIYNLKCLEELVEKIQKTIKKGNTEKATIPKAIREQCWIQIFGETFKEKCYINWCENDISVFDFHVGHDKPESEGGTLDVSNLKPICARCVIYL